MRCKKAKFFSIIVCLTLGGCASVEHGSAGDSPEKAANETSGLEEPTPFILNQKSCSVQIEEYFRGHGIKPDKVEMVSFGWKGALYYVSDKIKPGETKKRKFAIVNQLNSISKSKKNKKIKRNNKKCHKNTCKSSGNQQKHSCEKIENLQI